MGNETGYQLTTGQLPGIVSGRWLAYRNNIAIGQLITDTRHLSQVSEGVFFAIKGHNHDGHDYLQDAYDAGVRTLVVEHNIDLERYPDANIWLADTAVNALQKIAKYRRGSFDMDVIGITGSNAKTIIKEWLSAILQTSRHIVKSPKSYNSQIGVPLSVWQMNETHELAIFEAGISQPGEMKNLAEVIQPTIGLFTNLGSAHDAGFSSRQQKLQEKLVLFASASAIVYCADHVMVEKEIRREYPHKDLIAWSSGGLKAEVHVNYDSSVMHFSGRFGHFDIVAPFTDPSSLENLTHVIILLRLLEFQPEEIDQEVRTLKQVKMRLELKEGLNRTYIIDDSYNNDLSGLRVALEFLSRQNQYFKKTLVLAPIEQAAQDDAEVYRKVASMVNEFSLDRLIGIGDPIRKHLTIASAEVEYYDDVVSFLHDLPNFDQEIILVKGARQYHLEAIVAALQSKRHDTVLEINLEALVHNLNIYRAKLSSGTKLMVMVKAMAYGTGIREIAQVLQHHKVDYLGVAFMDEGVQLREAGISLPIMVMNSTPDQFALLSEYNLEPEIFSIDQLRHFIEHFSGIDNAPPVHLKLETGMHRLGIDSAELEDLVKLLSENEVAIAGIMTHLAGADDPLHDQYSHQQAETFLKAQKVIANAIGQQPLRHVLNSPGMLRFPQYHFDMVRLGIGLYGFDAANEINDQLRVVGTLRTYISRIEELEAGESVGYGRIWVAKRPTRVATLPIGYADGYRRAYSNGIGKVLLAEKLVPVIGSVCMDMCMIDVTDVPCEVGDEVVIFGEEPTIQDMAAWANTIPYEILTNVSDRVRRTFISE